MIFFQVTRGASQKVMFSLLCMYIFMEVLGGGGENIWSSKDVPAKIVCLKRQLAKMFRIFFNIDPGAPAHK